MSTKQVPTKWAFFSLGDKLPETVELAKAMEAMTAIQWRFLATQGSAKFLKGNGIQDVTDLSDIAGAPILGHRIASISRQLYSGILARPGVPEDLEELEKNDLPFIDFACVSFYALEKAIAENGHDASYVREKIDIGGPMATVAMAKGGKRIVINEHPQTIREILEWINAGCPDDSILEARFSAAAYQRVSEYYGDAAQYYDLERLHFRLHGKRSTDLKYGENPNQPFAVLYATDDTYPLALHTFKIVYGGTPSFVTMTDIDRVVTTMHSWAAGSYALGLPVPYTAIAVKHGNACGAGHEYTWRDAIRKAITGDDEAVLGATVLCNFPIDSESLNLIFRSHDANGKWGKRAAIVCPHMDEAAINILREKKSSCVVLTHPGLFSENLSQKALQTLPSQMKLRQVRGGVIVHEAPAFTPRFGFLGEKDFILHTRDTLLTDERPGSDTMFIRDLLLAWAVNSTSNSNTITIVRGGQLLGNAVGQQKRVEACELAVKKAMFAIRHSDDRSLANAVAWGDSFFPYTDGVQVLFEAGIKTIVATRGSKRDQEVIDFCRKNDIHFMTYPDSVARGFFGH